MDRPVPPLSADEVLEVRAFLAARRRARGPSLLLAEIRRVARAVIDRHDRAAPGVVRTDDLQVPDGAEADGDGGPDQESGGPDPFAGPPWSRESR